MHSRGGEDCKEPQFNQLQCKLLEGVDQPPNISPLLLCLPFHNLYGFWMSSSLYDTYYSQSGLSAGIIFEKS